MFLSHIKLKDSGFEEIKNPSGCASCTAFNVSLSHFMYRSSSFFAICFLCILALIMFSNTAYARNDLGSFPQTFGDSMSAHEPPPFAPMESYAPKDAPSLDMLELLSQGALEKLPPEVQKFLLKKGHEPLPVVVAPAQITRETTTFSDDTSTLARVPKPNVPRVSPVRDPYTFGAIVPGMEPLFRPMMDLNSLPSLKVAPMRVPQTNVAPVKPVEQAKTGEQVSTLVPPSVEEIAKPNVENALNGAAKTPTDDAGNVEVGEPAQNVGTEKTPVQQNNQTQNDLQQDNQRDTSVLQVNNQTQNNASQNNQNKQNNQTQNNLQQNPQNRAELDKNLQNPNAVQENKNPRAALDDGVPKGDLAYVLNQLNVNDLQIRAESGDVEAQYKLGLKYYNGTHVQKDTQKAQIWLEKAGKSGHAEALEVLRNL